MSGQRNPRIERTDLLSLVPCQVPAARQGPEAASLAAVASAAANEILHRELQHSGFLPPQASYSARLLAVAVLCPHAW